MKSIKFWVVSVVVVAVGAGGMVAFNMRKSAAKEAKARDEADKNRIAQVKFIQPRRGALERLCVQPGSVHSFESIQLYAKVAGFLETQNVDIGDRVTGPIKVLGVTLVPGQVLAKLYVPDIQAQVDRNKAAVDKAESVLKQMEARVKVAKANKTAADSEVTYAVAMEKVAVPWLKYRDIQLQRMTDLVARNAVEEKVRDESMSQKNTAYESLVAAGVKIATARANVTAADAKIEQAEADVKEAKAEIEVAQAELKKSQVNLDFATINAPFDGVITYRSMNPWDFVRAANEGGAPLLTIRRTDLYRVVVLVPASDVSYIKVGMPTTLTIDSLPGVTFYPRVSRFGKSLDSSTRLMRVELDLYHDDEGKICSAEDLERIYHDMYGQVTIVLDRGEKLMSIPTSCIVGKIDEGKGSVYVIKQGKLKKIDLKLGMDTGLRVFVDRVLTRGEELTEASQVIIEPSSELGRLPQIAATAWDDSPTIKITKTDR